MITGTKNTFTWIYFWGKSARQKLNILYIISTLNTYKHDAFEGSLLCTSPKKYTGTYLLVISTAVWTDRRRGLQHPAFTLSSRLTQHAKGSDQKADGGGRGVIILRWPYLLLTITSQRQAAVRRVTLELCTALQQAPTSSLSPSVRSLTASCQVAAPRRRLRATTVQRIMASQPAIIATPPTGASLPRLGSPVRAWWYRGPQNIPIPAIRMVPAWKEEGVRYSLFVICKVNYCEIIEVGCCGTVQPWKNIFKYVI